MNARRLIPMLGLLTLGAGLLPASSWAGDFIDSRISFTIGDDNFLKRGGEQLPDSPLIGIGDRPGYELAFDNLDLATTGRENELHLVLYKKVEGILPGLITEVAAAMEVNLAELELDKTQVNKVFSDDSSYIRLAYAIDPGKHGKKYIDVVLFPLSGDRFRVGYLYDLTWGGADMFPKKVGPSPAFKLGGNHGLFYWWGGMKMVLSPANFVYSTDEQGTKYNTADQETLFSGLAGLGAQPVEGLSVDLSGGHVQQAIIPDENWVNERVTSTGFSARLAYGRGLKVGLSSDLRLLRNDPEFLEGLSDRPEYSTDGKVSWRVALEGNAVAQVLADTELFGGTTRQWASAAALDLRLQRNYLRINATGVYRSLQFSLLTAPSLDTWKAIPRDASVQPQIFAALSADYHFARIALTPGVQGGVELPGAVKTELYASMVGANPATTLLGEHTMLVRSTGERVLLPEGEGRMPVYSVRVTARWYPSEILTLLAFVVLSYDQNATVIVKNADLTRSRVFDEPLRFGAGLTAQARF